MNAHIRHKLSALATVMSVLFTFACGDKNDNKRSTSQEQADLDSKSIQVALAEIARSRTHQKSVIEEKAPTVDATTPTTQVLEGSTTTMPGGRGACVDQLANLNRWTERMRELTREIETCNNRVANLMKVCHQYGAAARDNCAQAYRLQENLCRPLSKQQETLEKERPNVDPKCYDTPKIQPVPVVEPIVVPVTQPVVSGETCSKVVAVGVICYVCWTAAKILAAPPTCGASLAIPF